MEPSTRNIVWHLAAWPVIAAAAVVNGVVRDKAYTDAMGEEASHRVSAVPLISVIAAVAWWLARHRPLGSDRAAAAIGVAWFGVTEAFEFGLGRLEGKSWRELFHEYDVLAGRLWVVVLLITALAPWVAHRQAGRA